jgi:TrpR-related protein YerC/YecD
MSTPTNEDIDELFDAIASLEDRSEAAAFFRDIATRSEINGFAARWQIAQLLDEGVAYREIAEQMGTSTATVTRVNLALQHGSNGYRLILDRAAE